MEKEEVSIIENQDIEKEVSVDTSFSSPEQIDAPLNDDDNVLDLSSPEPVEPLVDNVELSSPEPVEPLVDDNVELSSPETVDKPLVDDDHVRELSSSPEVGKPRTTTKKKRNRKSKQS
jgi:hypothetical protein